MPAAPRGKAPPPIAPTVAAPVGPTVGLLERGPASPGPAPAPLPPLPAGRPSRDARLLALATLGAIAVLGGVGVGIWFLSGSDSGKRAHPASGRTAGSAAATGATARLVAAQEVEAVLHEYTASYSAENARGLERIFAPGLIRRDGSERPQDLKAALAEYRKQFSELRHPVYTFSDVHITPGHGEATAGAEYAIADQYGTVHGAITFHLLLSGEHLLIDRSTIHPAP